jgi:drug/metabolite transporter (DMT)-like permease
MLLAVLFVLAFFAFAKAVSVAGTAMAAVSSRLSVIVPILLSIVFFDEKPSLWQLLGFIFTLITILLFYQSLKVNEKKPGHIRDYVYLLGVLTGIGINDFFMKVFQHWRGETEKPFFLFTIFFFAFLYTFGYVQLKKISIDRNTALLGGVLGIPNIFSSYFLLSALAVLPGIIVYPVTNIGIILLTAVAAALLWKERLNRQGLFALISGILAIILLTF